MLAPDVAKKQLEEWVVAEGDTRFLSLVGQLPERLRPAGYTLLGRMADGSEQSNNWQAWNRQQEAAFAALDEGPVADRQAVFRVFYPNCPEAVEYAWQFLKQAPYQQHYAHRPFRAPHLPTATLEIRIAWLYELVQQCAPYRSDVITPAWLATWANYLGNGYGDRTGALGRLLAAVIDGGGKTGDEVFDILRQSALNEHEIGGMGRHVTRTLLLASRTDGWELMEKMLLAAQRQEGLRQAILETVDESHPAAFRRMLKVIRRENLVRFSAVVRRWTFGSGCGGTRPLPKRQTKQLTGRSPISKTTPCGVRRWRARTPRTHSRPCGRSPTTTSPRPLSRPRNCSNIRAGNAVCGDVSSFTGQPRTGDSRTGTGFGRRRPARRVLAIRGLNAFAQMEEGDAETPRINRRGSPWLRSTRPWRHSITSSPRNR